MGKRERERVFSDESMFVNKFVPLSLYSLNGFLLLSQGVEQWPQ